LKIFFVEGKKKYAAQEKGEHQNAKPVKKKEQGSAHYCKSRILRKSREKKTASKVEAALLRLLMIIIAV
jgi:hypothetical protein